MWFSWILFLTLTAKQSDQTVYPHVLKRDVDSETTRTAVNTKTTTTTTTAITVADSFWSKVLYVSDYGSDENDCHTESAPCKNLQTVLDRATDGADIYVTSDTLSLDGSRGRLSFHQWLSGNSAYEYHGSACTVFSNISYSIYSTNGTAIHVQCSEKAIHWTVADRFGTSLPGIASVNINNCNFSGIVLFTLYGLVNFGHCSFISKVSLILDVFKGSQELEPKIETVRKFHPNMEKLKLKIVESTFIGKNGSFPGVYLVVYNVAREILISRCEFINSYLTATNDDHLERQYMTIMSLQIEHSTFYEAGLKVQTSTNSYVLVTMGNNTLYNTYVRILGSKGIVGFHVEDSIWESHDQLMNLFEITYVNITNTLLRVYDKDNCYMPPCTPITIRGVEGANTLASHLFRTNSQLFMKAVMFEGAGAPMYKRYFNFEQISVVMIDSVFFIEESISIFTRNLEVKNVRVQCPKSKFPQRFRVKQVIVYGCDIPCTTDDKYTLESGSMTVSEKTRLMMRGVIGKIEEGMVEHSLSVNATEPSCMYCPLGANCGNIIDSLPNYWGYRDENDMVRMIRCPDGYCCTNNETCQGIDSCNTGRTGTLCGTCDQNLTEALFSAKCIPEENCHKKLVLVLYVLCALAYTLVLLTFSNIKVKILDLLKNTYKTCRDTLIGRKSKAQEKHELKELKSGKVPDLRKEANKDNQHGGMKYMQILFYYVQDATLFKVRLPDENQSKVNVLIKIIGFSPELLFIYTKTSDLCIAYTTAVAKVFYQSAIGFVMMILIFLVYLGQKLISCLVDKKSNFWITLRAKLVQAFLLIVLFSYQKLVIGSFTLVQCVVVGDHKALYIQGDIECFTWWQIIVQVYICTNIVPILFVLSLAPFYVQDRKMSVKIFILACLFPLPVMILYNLVRIRIGQANAENRSRHINMEEKISNVDEIKMASEIVATSVKGDELDAEDTPKHTDSEDEILYTLLKHYRTLKVFGIRFTWLGIHNMYRLMLVACNTYVTDPLIRLYAMSTVLLVVGVANSIVRPYKAGRANITATLSYAANGCIAIVNATKIVLATFGCETNCPFRNTFLWYLTKCEDVLLIYVPVLALGLWVVGTGLQKICSKSK